MSNVVVIVCDGPDALSLLKRRLESITFMAGFKCTQFDKLDKFGPHVLMRPLTGDDSSLLLTTQTIPTLPFRSQRQCIVSVKSLNASKVAATVNGMKAEDDFVSHLGRVCVVRDDSDGDLPEIVLVEVTAVRSDADADADDGQLDMTTRKTQLLMEWAMQREQQSPVPVPVPAHSHSQ
jgi:hypothetical protein